MSEELIIKEIENNQEVYIKFLREIIQTNSYNPPGNEMNVALKIKQFLKDVDIKCEIFPFGENRANLLAYLNNNFNNKNLIYNGHMDCVLPGSENDWKFPPLSASIKRNKFIYGRGAADMKGGLCAMIIALKVLKKLELKISGNLILNAVADEETGGELGTKWSLKNKLETIKCDFAIIGEPTTINPLLKAVLVGEKGHLVVKVIVNGISCHSSIPSMGRNAIYIMSDLIQNLDILDDYIPKVVPPISKENLKKFLSNSFPNIEIFTRIYNEQPILQRTIESLIQFTKSLNIIKGGIKDNVVPDHCEAIIDIRLLPGQTTKMVLNGLKKLIGNLGYKLIEDPKDSEEGVSIYLEVLRQHESSFWENWENSQALKDFCNIYDKIYNNKPFYFITPGATDAHYFRNSGYCTQTINIGPGSAYSAHTINEYIDIKDFINMLKVYTLFAFNFLK